MANKLNLRKDEEKINQSLIMDGVLGIQDGQNPKVIEGVLRNYLPASKREINTEE
jgi:chemotaxis protein MotA